MDITKFNEQLPIITKEQVESGLISDVTKKNFFKLLETGKNATIDKQTIKQSYETLLSIREVYLFLDELEDKATQTLRDLLKAVKSGFDVYKKPLKQLLEAAEPLLTKVNAEIHEEDELAIHKINVHNLIRNQYIDFVKDTVKAIVSSLDTKELARLQKLIGTEKSRSSFYGDYHSKVEATCDMLLKLVDERKDTLRENNSLHQKKEQAKAAGDHPLEIELKEQIERNQQVLQEHAEVIAESAFSEVAGIPLLSTEIQSASITPRTHRWSWRIDDPHLLYKKMPDLVSIEGKPKEIKAFMDSKSTELKEDKDNNYHGLVLYRKPFFVEIKS